MLRMIRRGCLKDCHFRGASAGCVSSVVVAARRRWDWRGDVERSLWKGLVVEVVDEGVVSALGISDVEPVVSSETITH